MTEANERAIILSELDAARKEVERWDKAWNNYSGNNPEKYRTERMAAARRYRMALDEAKAAGLAEVSGGERLQKEIDAAYPDAQSRQVVEFRGKRYLCRYYPLEKSRSGKTVHAWGRRWELIGEGPTEV